VGEDGRKKPNPKTAKMQNFIYFPMYGRTKFPTDQYESKLKLTDMVSQSSKQLLLTTPAESLIRIFILQVYRQPEKIYYIS
jgi:hypothetical protein